MNKNDPEMSLDCVEENGTSSEPCSIYIKLHLLMISFVFWIAIAKMFHLTYF